MLRHEPNFTGAVTGDLSVWCEVAVTQFRELCALSRDKVGAENPPAQVLVGESDHDRNRRYSSWWP
jgi:hypothetical protein